MKVTFSETATEELVAIGLWIGERAGREVAEAYLARVRAACDKLSLFPRRGTPRDHLEPGLRSVTFERRIVIAYRVEQDRVLILRLIRTARDIAAQLPSGPFDRE